MMNHPLTAARLRADDVPHIPPALTADQWHELSEPSEMAPPNAIPVYSELVHAADHGQWHRAVALANAALPDGDPRKLTPLHVQQLHMEGVVDANFGDPERGAWKLSLAAAIASLLPPAWTVR